MENMLTHSFSPLSTTEPRIHAVLNAVQPPRNAKGQPRKAWICTFGLVAGPSTTEVTKEELQTGTPVKKGGKASGDGDELGRWDVLARREVGKKPVTVFDVR